MAAGRRHASLDCREFWLCIAEEFANYARFSRFLLAALSYAGTSSPLRQNAAIAAQG
jgi:hypothetical protein